MKVRDIWNEEHDLIRGMTVRWSDQHKVYAGMMVGVVIRIDDKSVSILSIDGDYHNIHPRNLTMSSDNRMLDLFELDPQVALESGDEYASAWEERFTADQEVSPNKNKKRRGGSSGRIPEIIKLIEDSEH